MLVKLKNIILVFNYISDFEWSDESMGAREIKLYLHFFYDCHYIFKQKKYFNLKLLW